LQQLIGIFEEVPELFALCAEGFGGELRRYFDSRYGRVFRHITNLIDLDAGFTGERRLQLFRQRGRLGIAAWKGAHKPRELWLGQRWREVDAGDSRAHQHLGEAFFACGCAERHTIQQNLIPGSSEQKAASAALIERTSELFPRSLKLRRRPHVAKLIEACELE
jgi:hypothetical protein